VSVIEILAEGHEDVWADGRGRSLHHRRHQACRYITTSLWWQLREEMMFCVRAVSRGFSNRATVA